MSNPEPRLAERVLSGIYYVPHTEASHIVERANASDVGELLEMAGRMAFECAVEDKVSEKSFSVRAGRLILDCAETISEDEINEAWRALGMLGIVRMSRVGSNAISRQASWNALVVRNSLALYFPTAEDNEYWGTQNG